MPIFDRHDDVSPCRFDVDRGFIVVRSSCSTQTFHFDILEVGDINKIGLFVLLKNVSKLKIQFPLAARS